MSDRPTPDPRPSSPSRRTLLALSVPVLLSGAGAIAVTTDDEPPTGDAVPAATSSDVAGPSADVLALIADERSLDGTGNNLDDPGLGAAGTIYRRVATAEYADGVGEPETGPAERALSNRIFDDDNQNIFSENGVTHWGFVWGQFIDHTIGLRATDDDEQMTIAFDPDDPLEEFSNDLGAIITDRSAVADATGVDTPREQVNTVSSYIDAWAVYGGSDERLDWLREGTVDGDPTNNEATLADRRRLPPDRRGSTRDRRP